ncbi:MAG: GrpB family protein [Candidatus Izemoplasma sp.]|nr:GrpB family protein [Candidatus Izemoplasma sp.]
MATPLHKRSKDELWQLFPIQLRLHNPNYTQWYNDEKTLLESVLGEDIKRMNHIGSTAVDNLLAKPIIDILLEVEEETDLNALLPKLFNHDYINMNPEQTVLPKLIIKGYTEEGFNDRVFHLHIRPLSDHNELYFRDYLIEFNAVKEAYAELKKRLFKSFEHHREHYTDGKTDFINRHTEAARKRYKDRYKPIKKSIKR